MWLVRYLSLLLSLFLAFPDPDPALLSLLLLYGVPGARSFSLLFPLGSLELSLEPPGFLSGHVFAKWSDFLMQDQHSLVPPSLLFSLSLFFSLSLLFSLSLVPGRYFS